MSWREQPTGGRRSGWVSLMPNGVGLQKPNQYRDMAKVPDYNAVVTIELLAEP